MQDYLEQWNNISSTAFASLKELTEINAKALERFTEQQLGFFSACLDTGVKQINLISEAKGYKDLFSGQARLVAEFNEKTLDAIRKAGGVVAESKDQLTAWVEKGMESTISPLKKVTPVKKAAA